MARLSLVLRVIPPAVVACLAGDVRVVPDTFR